MFCGCLYRECSNLTSRYVVLLRPAAGTSVHEVNESSRHREQQRCTKRPTTEGRLKEQRVIHHLERPHPLIRHPRSCSDISLCVFLSVVYSHKTSQYADISCSRLSARAQCVQIKAVLLNRLDARQSSTTRDDGLGRRLAWVGLSPSNTQLCLLNRRTAVTAPLIHSIE